MLSVFSIFHQNQLISLSLFDISNAKLAYIAKQALIYCYYSLQQQRVGRKASKSIPGTKMHSGGFQHDIRYQRTRIELPINFEQDLLLTLLFSLQIKILISR